VGAKPEGNTACRCNIRKLGKQSISYRACRRKKTWWRNLKEVAQVRLTVRGQAITGKAVVLKPDSDSEKILEGFGLYLDRFPALIKYHHSQVETDGSFNSEELRRAAMQAVIIRVELE
jgi:hypothetical protein